MITIAEILRFVECTVSSSNFLQGEKLLQSNHVMKCGKVLNTGKKNNTQIFAYCLQNDVEKKPCIIKGEIAQNGTIKVFQCSCNAGSPEKCEHIIAVLLYCHKNNMNLERFSNSEVLEADEEIEKNEVRPLCEHKCFVKTYKSNDIKLTSEQEAQIQDLMMTLKDSAYAKHMQGRSNQPISKE